MEENNDEEAQAQKVVADELAAQKKVEEAAAQKTAEEAAIKEAAAKKDPGIIPKETQKAEDLISQANTAAIRQEDANKIHEELLNREESIKVEETLGGKAAAGSKEQSEEEKEIQSTKDFLKGTGYENDLFPEK